MFTDALCDDFADARVCRTVLFHHVLTEANVIGKIGLVAADVLRLVEFFQRILVSALLFDDATILMDLPEEVTFKF